MENIQELLVLAPQLLPYLGYLGVASIVLRIVAEILNKVSLMTENKKDDKAAEIVSEISWQVAKIAALFGARASLRVPEHLREDDPKAEEKAE